MNKRARFLQIRPRSLPRKARTSRHPLAFTQTGCWLILRLAGWRTATSGALGAAGLWKTFPGQDALASFALPLSILSFPLAAPADECDLQPALDTPESIRALLLAWALSTAGGRRPAGWVPPSPDLVAELFPVDRRTIQRGPVASEITVLLASGQFALRVELASIDPALPPRRLAWLEKYLTSAHALWPFARIGRDPASGAVLAEVDLTGAPSALLPPLLQAARDSLRWIVENLTETAQFLASGDSACEALDVLFAG